MKTLLTGIFILFIASTSTAQYYYSDIAGTKQTNQLYKLLRSYQYKHINAVSYDGGQASKDFVLEQTIAGDGSRITTRSASVGNTESYFIGYYKANRITRSTDSGNNAINTVLYDYDNTGKIILVSSESKDFDGTFINAELHKWSYNAKGLPDTMLKIKNITDTTWVTFTADENDNIAEEKWTRNNRTIETYYYYYNTKKLLTDIVRFSRKAKAMLPDYMFEYDNTSHITQMTQTQSGSANYLVWKYQYNENGMKQKEVVFNKQKEMLGSIEYSYQ